MEEEGENGEMEGEMDEEGENEGEEEENIPSFGEGFIEICPKDYGSMRDACEKEFPLHPDVLLGKRKNEVIALSMEFAERTSSNEVRFAAKDDYGHFCEYPHSSKAEAEQDERLLKSDVWEVFYVTEKTIVGAHDKCIEITFKDGRVSSFEIKTLSDAI